MWLLFADLLLPLIFSGSFPELPLPKLQCKHSYGISTFILPYDCCPMTIKHFINMLEHLASNNMLNKGMLAVILSKLLKHFFCALSLLLSYEVPSVQKEYFLLSLLSLYTFFLRLCHILSLIPYSNFEFLFLLSFSPVSNFYNVLCNEIMTLFLGLS